ncbi:MAG: phospho-N-acetylmuramoyl-pentapeptide-transferase [Clostridia bacterium]|nr:phospho-N-acetylmuramoyl-pentapeptide-transferase [Clostridia bacterium]
MILATLLSAAVVIVLGLFVIPMLRKLKLSQKERKEGPQSHLAKAGTPSMGGIMILAGVITGTLAFSLDSIVYALPSLAITLACGIIGFIDDYVKIKGSGKGLRAYQKTLAQLLVAIAVALYGSRYFGTTIEFAFFDVSYDLGWLYIPMAVVVVLACVNSVNLIDGVDGLSSSVTLIYSLAMGLIFVVLSRVQGDSGLVMQGQGYEGMAVFAGAIAGGCLGFLRYNAYPAKVMMGDTGSLALGGAVAMMALSSRAVLLLIIMGGCYVATSLSVILQVGSYKLRHKRIFKMAPLHHHFELMGVSEPKVVAGYAIVTAVLCLVGLLAYV